MYCKHPKLNFAYAIVAMCEFFRKEIIIILKYSLLHLILLYLHAAYFQSLLRISLAGLASTPIRGIALWFPDRHLISS